MKYNRIERQTGKVNYTEAVKVVNQLYKNGYNNCMVPRK